MHRNNIFLYQHIKRIKKHKKLFKEFFLKKYNNKQTFFFINVGVRASLRAPPLIS